MRKLIIGLVSLLALALVVDFGVAAYSEYRVSRAIREGGDLPSDPQVTIHGFPFLTQAVDGKYQNVEIRAQDVPNEYVRATTIEANLRGVSIPLSELADGSVHTVPVDDLDGRVRIEATDLGRFLGIVDLQVSAPPADKSDGTGGSGGSGMTTNGGVVLTGTVPVGPIETSVSVQADLILEGDSVKIVASDFYFGPEGSADFTIPDFAKSAVLGLFTKTIDRQTLPFGILPTDVYAEGSQIVIEGSASNVTISLDEIEKQ
ncbi:LmeA family phospholipid-binding protein [Rhodococcoides yunnanense]|uniref:LmeA family phospholipid-binding protein n=1 Tax=Rhodococcoides yunnanense TaxID=278209 RepID=UPI000934646E|nr:LmeA family phospholipid-binding protein [Rhodococcus yunnanensis]